MARSHYDVLGVSKHADAKQIKKAYRQLARDNHPDHHPDDAAAESRFKDIGRAYDVLSDPNKRSMYDEFGEDAEKIGFDPEKAKAYRQWQHGGGGSGGFGFNGAGGVDLNDLLSSLFGQGMGGQGRGGGFGGGRQARRRTQDYRARVTIDFTTAVLGGERSFSSQDLGDIKVRIPPGVREGGALRLRGKGQLDPMTRQRGDLLLELTIAPHPAFTRDGDHLRLDVPITLGEAMLGGRIDVPTLTGHVRVRVPPNTASGAVLRLRGKGVAAAKRPAGDLLVKLKVVLPSLQKGDEAAGAAVEVLEAAYTQDVRATLYREVPDAS
jgi:DnaJ-class molecular chaperone